MRTAYIITATIFSLLIIFSHSCAEESSSSEMPRQTEFLIIPDTSNIPTDKYGELVRYGRELMVNTSYYIGQNGINGKYTGNKINCTNCHQDAGTKPFSFNLMMTHDSYPQYRAREGKVLSLAERVNNCIERPCNGKPLPLDSKEMIAYLAYIKWINDQVPEGAKVKGGKNLQVEFPDRAADPDKGAIVYQNHCQRCHGVNGEGLYDTSGNTINPALWGEYSYQPGSSMHRVIKMAQWIKANMPNDSAKWDKPILTDLEAMDVAAFVNNDLIHSRPDPKTFDYPHPEEKAIDYGRAPFADTFSEHQHKYGPYKPIIEYWKSKGRNPSY